MAKETFTLTPESRLSAELKAGKLRRAYFLYGEEVFLTGMYAGMISKLAGAETGDGLNLLKMRGAPDMDVLSDFAESMPFFSECKCVRITDIDAEALDNDQSKRLISLIEQLPDTTVLVIAMTGVEVDDKKPRAKTKKLIQTIEKCGAVCRFSFLPVEKTAAMAVKKAAKSGCTLSPENARHLSELCGRSLTLIQNEVEKLCSFRQSGEITREAIDRLTPRMIDASTFALADLILARKTAGALRLMDDLFTQQTDPVIILSSLSGAFVDYYRAKLAIKAGKPPRAASKDFQYFGGRAYYFEQTFTPARRVSEDYIKTCLEVLFRTNLLLNSSKADRQTLLERAVIEMTGARQV